MRSSTYYALIIAAMVNLTVPSAVIQWKLENDLPRKVTLPSKSESDRLKAYYESQLKKIEVEKASDVLMKTETHIQQMSGAILSVRNSLLCVSATMTSLFRAHAGEDWRILADTLQTEMERSLNLLADEVETDD